MVKSSIWITIYRTKNDEFSIQVKWNKNETIVLHFAKLKNKNFT